MIRLDETMRRTVANLTGTQLASPFADLVFLSGETTAQQRKKKRRLLPFFGGTTERVESLACSCYR